MPNFGVAKCVICSQEFERKAPCGTCCSSECSIHNKVNMKKKWDEENRDHVNEYSKTYRPRNNEFRKKRRQSLYEYWGRNGRIDWQLAEDVAIDILKQEGFEDVKQLTNYSIMVPFDIIGFKQEQGFVFQVTTRSHTNKSWQHKLARDMRLIHKVLFISMKNKIYLIKDLSPTGFSELNFTEVKQARRFS